MERLVSLLGLMVILLLAWLLSENRRRVPVRVVVSGIALQLVLALVLLRSPPGQAAFEHAQNFAQRVLSFSDVGAEFVFGQSFREHMLAFSVLPTIIFVSSATAVLFHLGIMQLVVKGIARVMVWAMDTSGSESLAAGAEIFVGMTESPLMIRPYLETMTRSELMAMMTAGLGTVAGGVLALYMRWYAEAGAASGHLLAASLMAAPASLVVAKVMVPETQASLTKGVVRVEVPKIDANVIDAACRGATDGLKLALNVAAMLIAFLALLACINWMLAGASGWLFSLLGIPAEPLSLERILGWIFCPLAWVIGVPWQDAQIVGMLLGKKLVLNELLAYQDLLRLKDELSSQRSLVIATYALCGFANFASVAILVGGVGGLVPSRRKELAQLGLRAMVGGALATLMTACIAGVLV